MRAVRLEGRVRGRFCVSGALMAPVWLVLWVRIAAGGPPTGVADVPATGPTASVADVPSAGVPAADIAGEPSPGAVVVSPPGLELPPALRQRIDGPVELEAGLLELFRREQRLHASGGVTLRMGARRLTAPALTLELETGVLRVEGPFQLEAPAGTFTGEYAELRIDSPAGVVYRGTLVTAGSRLHLSAGRLERAPDGNYTLNDAVLTPCDCEAAAARLCPDRSSLRPLLARPSFSFEAHRVRLSLSESGEGRAVFERGVLRLKGLPVFYLPRGTVPVGQERLPGPRAPELYFNADGANLRLPFVWFPGPHSDLTLGILINQARGVKPDLELRYRVGEGGGRFRASWIYDFERVAEVSAGQEAAAGVGQEAAGANGQKVGAGAGSGGHRWALSWQHRSGAAQGLRLAADIHEVSDADYLRDFGRDLETRSDDVLTSTARAGLRAGGQQAWLGFTHHTELDSLAGAAALGRFPEVRIDLRGRSFGGRWGLLGPWLEGRTFYQTSLPAWGEPVVPPDGGTLFASIRPAFAFARPVGHFAASGGLEYFGIAAVAPGADAAEGGGTVTAEGTATVSGHQALTGWLELSTGLARTFERPGRRFERLQHRIEPALRTRYDLWYAQDAGFVAPVGEPTGRLRRFTGELTQRLWGRRARSGGGSGSGDDQRQLGDAERLELATLRLALGRDLEPGGGFTDLAAELTVGGPLSMRVSSLIDPDTGRIPWLFARSRLEGGYGWLEVGYGLVDSSLPARPPDGLEIEPASSAEELQLGVRLQLQPALSWMGRGSRWLEGFALEARERLDLSGAATPLSQRFSLVYASPCRCFSARLFVAIDRDSTVPEVGGGLTPGAWAAAGEGGLWP